MDVGEFGKSTVPFGSLKSGDAFSYGNSVYIKLGKNPFGPSLNGGYNAADLRIGVIYILGDDIQVRYLDAKIVEK